MKSNLDINILETTGAKGEEDSEALEIEGEEIEVEDEEREDAVEVEISHEKKDQIQMEILLNFIKKKDYSLNGLFSMKMDPLSLKLKLIKMEKMNYSKNLLITLQIKEKYSTLMNLT